VNRGSAWTASACPPIKRYWVPVEVSARKNSFQSSFRCKVPEPCSTEPLDDREPLFRGRFFEAFEVEGVRFFEARDPDDALNGHLHCPTIPSAASAHRPKRDAGHGYRHPITIASSNGTHTSATP